MKNYIHLLFIGLTFGALFGYGFSNVRNAPRIDVEERVDTLYVCDTITQIEPVYEIRRVKEYSYIPVIDTLRLRDTLYMEMPVDEMVYTDDSTYYAVISGINPSLDTMRVFRNDKIITIDRVHNIPIKKWTFGATVGPGVMINPNGNISAGVGAVVGLTYNF